MLFCHITTRIEGRENDGMLRDVGGTGFPTIAYLDASGELLGKHQGGRNAAGFSASHAAINAMLTAKKRVDAGDKAAEAALLIAQIKLGSVDLEQAKTRYENLEEITDAEEETVLDLLNGLEFSAMYMKVRRRQMTREDFEAKILEMLENGRAPREGDGARDFWYSGVMPAALTKKDVELAERAMKTLEAHPFFTGDNERYLERYRKALADLKGDG